jgi:hypothetical protein
LTRAPQIAFLDMRPSIAVRDAVDSRERDLARLCHRLEKCRVLVEAPHRHAAPPEILYGIRIRLTLCDDEIAIEIQPQEVNVYDAIQDGFETARNKLEDYERRRRDDRGRSGARGRRPHRRAGKAARA